MSMPHAIAKELVRQQEKMGWPEYVPTFAEFRRPGGKLVFIHHESVTVGLCEQVVEHYLRIARKAFVTWQRTRSDQARRKVASNLLRARVYRCRYISLTGQENTTEADMPQLIEA